MISEKNHSHRLMIQRVSLVGDKPRLLQECSEVCFGCDILVFDVVIKFSLAFL